MRRCKVPRPRVVFSACLVGENVRYDGKPVKDSFAEALRDHVEVIGVCPETGIGLGVPRDRIVLFKEGDEPELAQPSTGLVLTERMRRFSAGFLRSLSGIDGFLLKSKSPSCGLSRVRIYRDPRARRFRGLGRGIFALEVLRRFPHLPAEDEGRLSDRERRLRFLLLIFALALLRDSPDTADFHRRVSSSLRIFAPGLEKRLRSLPDPSAYRVVFLKAVGKVPTPVLLRMFGDFVPPLLRRYVDF